MMNRFWFLLKTEYILEAVLSGFDSSSGVSSSSLEAAKVIDVAVVFADRGGRSSDAISWTVSTGFTD